MDDAVEGLSQIEFDGVGPLTKSEYVRWYAKLSTHRSEFLSEYSIARAEWEFDFISQSDYLIENFFALNRTLQRAVHLFADNDNRIEDIYGFVVLALNVGDIDPSFDLGNASVFEMDKFLASHLDVDAFSDLLGQYWGFYPKTNLYLILGIPLMLAILLGEEVVLNALERWVSVPCPGMPKDFANVVSDWQELENYAIDWAVQISRLSNS